MLLLIFYSKAIFGTTRRLLRLSGLPGSEGVAVYYNKPAQVVQPGQCHCPECPAWLGSFSALKDSNLQSSMVIVQLV